jgi:hypothetical protein
MRARDKLRTDFEYVRSVVDEAEYDSSPAAIYWLWAAISLVGFPLYDYDPRAGSLFWSFAGPLGGLASFLIGSAWSRRVGRGSARIARYHALHWAGLLVAIFLAVALASRRDLGSDVAAQMILLVLAFGYYVAGIYLVRRMLWIGLLLAACFIATLAFEQLGLTFVGVLLAASLALSTWRGGRGRRAEA